MLILVAVDSMSSIKSCNLQLQNNIDFGLPINTVTLNTATFNTATPKTPKSIPNPSSNRIPTPYPSPNESTDTRNSP